MYLLNNEQTISQIACPTCDVDKMLDITLNSHLSTRARHLETCKTKTRHHNLIEAVENARTLT